MGDTVKVITGENTGNEYQVIAISEQAVNDMFGNPSYIDFGTSLEYRYRLKSISDGSTKYFDEAELEVVPKSEKEVLMEQFSEYVNQAERIPAYRIGDVVTIPESSSKRIYVIRESIDYGPSIGIAYEIFRPDNTERIVQFAESALEFQYHDVSWEYELTEGTRMGNGLTSWRGRLYNFYMFYDRPDRHGKLDKDQMKEYWDSTIPPEFMEHILKSHSVWDRMDVVFNSSENKHKLMSIFKMDDNQLQDIRDDIRDKITTINMNDVKPNAHGKVMDFTKEELAFIDQVLMLDDVKDHYPVQMSYLNIMRAIKEAYECAYKTNDKIKMQPSLDRRTGETKRSVRGQRKYRGESKNGMLIEFWYDLDLKVIMSAYPIDTHAKKY